MTNNHQTNRKELAQLLHRTKALGLVVGIEALVPILRANLTHLKQGRDIGLRDHRGEPIRSLRSFARAMGNESAYSYLSKFANENAMPCLLIMNQIANTMGIEYLIVNFDAPHYIPAPQPPVVSQDHEVRMEA